MPRRTKPKIITVLVLIIIGLALAMLVATADSLETPVQRENLTVHMLNVSGARIYLVERSGKRIMIDSGNPGDEKKIETFMREAGIAPESVDYLIITHGHLDHIGTVKYFQERYGIKVIGGVGDSEMFSEGTQQPLCSTSLLAVAIDAGLRGKTYPLFDADMLVGEEYDLEQLGIEGSILTIPGHTEGSLLVTFDDVVFVGDLIRGEVFRPRTPTRHFFMCDLEDNDEDIRSVLGMSHLEYWFPGHFGPLEASVIAQGAP